VAYLRIPPISLFSYRLPFKNPQKIKGKSHLQRTGLLLEIKSEKGWKVYGEASPLLGFSSETYEEVKNQLIQICADMTNKKLEGDILPNETLFFRFLKEGQFFPSSCFALDMLRYNFLFQETSSSSEIKDDLKNEIYFQGLLWLPPGQLEMGFDILKKKGFQTI